MSDDFNIPEYPPEYSLSGEEIPAEFQQRMSPWVRGFIGLDSAQAKRRLMERWGKISNPVLRQFAERLQGFEIDVCADFEVGGVISALRPGASGNKIGDRWFLPAPLERSYWKERLTSFDLSDHEGVLEFFECFGGLAENTFESGRFRYCEENWPIFSPGEETYQGWPWPEAINDYPGWHGSFGFYQALNGGKLLLRSDGATGWWIMQEQRVEEVAASFDEFVDRYTEHWSSSRPFDPYSRR